MSGKRQATSNLNHENWDQEEEPEERGTFRKASEDELNKRVIKKARRKVAGNSGADATDDGAPKSVFSGFSGFGKPTSAAPTSSPFSFLSKITTPVDSNNEKTTTTFSFGAAAKAPLDTNNAKNTQTFSFGASTKTPSDSNNVKSTPTFSFGAAAKAPLDSDNAKATPTFSFGSASKALVDSNNAKNSPHFSFGSTAKASVPSEIKDTVSTEKEKPSKRNSNERTGKSASYQSKIKCLNHAVTEWIKTHVDKNPLCILTPIFKDYEKYINEIEEEEKKLEKLATNNTNDKKLTSTSVNTFTFSASPPKLTTTSAGGAGATFSFGLNSTTSHTVSASSTSTFTTGTKPSTETTKANTFSFGIKPTESSNSGKDANPTQRFSFGLNKSDDKAITNVSTSFTFGKPTTTNGETAEKNPAPFSFTPGSTPFSFGNIKPPAPSTSDGANGADDEEDQPPKVEFKQVVEEDAVYSKKCKVFVKKDGAFAERGVGTLYLKPVKDSEKMQLLVRADTNLGNILVNLILSSGIPTQRMGKNNVMMVCLPTPDVEKATSMLLRVKTGEDADELLAELEKHKK